MVKLNRVAEAQVRPEVEVVLKLESMEPCSSVRRPFSEIYDRRG